MKYIVVVLVLALGASAVSAASVFLHSEAARLITSDDSGGVSVSWMLTAVTGMMVTIAWRCRMADGGI